MPSIAFCGLTELPGAKARIERRPTGEGSASLSGVRRCGSPSCPTCGPRLAARRTAALHPQLATLVAKGWELWLVTFTIRHERGDDLVANLGVLGKAWGRFTSGAKWKTLTAPGLEWVRGLDLTLGGPNGDHPHYHVVFAVPPEQPKDFMAKLLARWKAITARLGVAALDAGLNAQRAGSVAEATGYAISSDKSKSSTSVVLEAVGAAVKHGATGRTMHDLAVAAVVGRDPQAFRLWQAGAVAMKGRRMVATSKGLSLDDLEAEAGEDVLEAEPVAELTAEGLREADRHMGDILPAARESVMAGRRALLATLGPPGRFWRMPGSTAPGPQAAHTRTAYAYAGRHPPGR